MAQPPLVKLWYGYSRTSRTASAAYEKDQLMLRDSDPPTHVQSPHKYMDISPGHLVLQALLRNYVLGVATVHLLATECPSGTESGTQTVEN